MAIPLDQVISSNQRIGSTFPNGLVVVFIGATSGIGEYTLRALVQYIQKLRIYIVGRSQAAADLIISECTQHTGSAATFTFIQADVSIMKNVDDVCAQIKTKETAINLLFQSQGTMNFAARTPDNLPLTSALSLYSRIRFITNLLPLLRAAPSLRRVINVGAATCEGPIDTSNMLAENVPLLKWRDQTASIATLLLEEMARRAPEVSFVHDVPGVVRSNISRDATGFRLALMLCISRLLMPFIAVPEAESGERHVFWATSAMFPPKTLGSATAGVSLDESLAASNRGTLKIANGKLGTKGTGVYSIGIRGEAAPPRVETVLASMRENGVAAKVYDYISADLARITGSGL